MNELTPFLDSSDLGGLGNEMFIEGDGRAHASEIASNDADFNAQALKLAVHQRGEEALVGGADVGQRDCKQDGAVLVLEG